MFFLFLRRGMEKLSKMFNFTDPKHVKKLIKILAYIFMMKFSRREGDFRCRPPRTCKVLIVFIFILKLLQAANGSSCGYNEALQCSNSNSSDCSCVKCLVCPPGEGLYPQCGSRVLKNNTTMQCKPCKMGTYSDQRDFGSCRSCDPCARVGQETLRKCTATQNAICKKGSCIDGFQWDDMIKMCEQVPFTPSKHAQRSTISQKAMTVRPSTDQEGPILASSNTSGNVSGPNETVPTTMIKQRKTKPPQIIPTRTPSVKEQPILKSSNMTSKNESDSNEKVIKPIKEIITRTPDWAYYIIAFLCLLLLLFLCYMGFKNREKIKTRYLNPLYCSCKRFLVTDEQIEDPIETTPMHPDLGEEVELEEIVSSNGRRADMDQMQQGERAVQGPARSRSDEQDPQLMVDHAANSSPMEHRGEEATHIPDLYAQKLKDIPDDLKCSISVKISKKVSGLKGWEEMGGLFDISKDTLEEVETRCSYGSQSKLPGQELFDLLVSSKPNLTVKEFIVKLKLIDREDVIDRIHEKWSKLVKGHT
ncbi:uncharacterized protein LOC116308138 isoform X2 [Actinia tenebrosa]|uniref:Uncharacterized protein LOC116308138 isoform X2 n=1 Tax=Actinia tenebrosa TaxID=6105 RepID=A0A6P8J432_ACTTE|nr:uncharacterized protein LOC116308138 isoform X2 [Actinia tenebrosa]